LFYISVEGKKKGFHQPLDVTLASKSGKRAGSFLVFCRQARNVSDGRGKLLLAPSEGR